MKTKTKKHKLKESCISEIILNLNSVHNGKYDYSLLRLDYPNPVIDSPIISQLTANASKEQLASDLIAMYQKITLLQKTI